MVNRLSWLPAHCYTHIFFYFAQNLKYTRCRSKLTTFPEKLDSMVLLLLDIFVHVLLEPSRAIDWLPYSLLTQNKNRLISTDISHPIFLRAIFVARSCACVSNFSPDFQSDIIEEIVDEKKALHDLTEFDSRYTYIKFIKSNSMKLLLNVLSINKCHQVSLRSLPSVLPPCIQAHLFASSFSLTDCSEQRVFGHRIICNHVRMGDPLKCVNVGGIEHFLSDDLLLFRKGSVLSSFHSL